jgi:hypothetical protein
VALRVGPVVLVVVVVLRDAEGGEEPLAVLAEQRVAVRAGVRAVDGQVEADAALVEHEHPVGEHDRLVDVVGDQQHGGPVALPQLAQQGVHPDPGERVQRAERLVGQQEFGLADERAGQRGALLPRRRTARWARPARGPRGRPRRGRRGPSRSASLPREPEQDVVEDRCQGSSRESWKTTDTLVGAVSWP